MKTANARAPSSSLGRPRSRPAAPQETMNACVRLRSCVDEKVSASSASGTIVFTPLRGRSDRRPFRRRRQCGGI
ncbi:MAG: hypothetical protein R2856_37875 [Caldilineaceae bacterium]